MAHCDLLDNIVDRNIIPDITGISRVSVFGVVECPFPALPAGLLEVLTELLSSLRDEIPLIQTFMGKWSLIRAKLNDLHPQFADNCAVVSNSGNSGSSSKTEAVHAESRNLITRLQIGTPDSIIRLQIPS
ncbi:hypothetical protein L484_027911 [Morus notabilis]|uniref:DUF7032 domain-containing protein n=1 Tax=Morus notabilis TaxID=981085 RepID=W9S7J8_9ROSA|nr:hypothetical protein L484_027911 [Morus notabilis]